jgi:hypothetical protein
MGVLRGLGRAIGGLLAGVFGLVRGLLEGVGRLLRRLFECLALTGSESPLNSSSGAAPSASTRHISVVRRGSLLPRSMRDISPTYNPHSCAS